MPKIRTDFAEPAPLPTPRLALSIPEFCKAHGISEGFFYKLKKQGEGPREMKVGARTLISFESAAEWRRARETKHTEIIVSPREQSDEAHGRTKKDRRGGTSATAPCKADEAKRVPGEVPKTKGGALAVITGRPRKAVNTPSGSKG
jgi:predicted DNA-binding transcriptional regulator AlpA